MFAVIKAGGKQYKVAANDVIRVERLDGEAGDAVAFGEVLMLDGEGGTVVGSPLVEGASVAGEVVDQIRTRKIIVFKKRRRKNSRRSHGHRQSLTVVRITDIMTAAGETAPKAKRAQKTAAPAAEAPEAAQA